MLACSRATSIRDFAVYCGAVSRVRISPANTVAATIVMISSRRFHTIFQYWRNIGMAVLATPPPAAEPTTGLISVIEFMGFPIDLSPLNPRNAGRDAQGAREADRLESTRAPASP